MSIIKLPLRKKKYVGRKELKDNTSFSYSFLTDLLKSYTTEKDKKGLINHTIKKIYETTNATLVLHCGYNSANKTYKIESLSGEEILISQLNRLLQKNLIHYKFKIGNNLKIDDNRAQKLNQELVSNSKNRNINNGENELIRKLNKYKKYIIGLYENENLSGCIIFYFSQEISKYKLEIIENLINTMSLINSLSKLEDNNGTHNKMFNDIIAELPEPLAITELDTGNIISYNKEMAKLAEIETQHLKNNSSIKLGIWENSAQEERFLKILMREGFVRNYELNVNDSDNNPRKVLLSSVIINNENKKSVLTSIKDITAVKYYESLNRTLFNITKKANNSGSFKSVLKKIHSELNKIVDAENFYIAIYDKEKKKYCFPYHYDKYDNISEYELIDLNGSLTDYVRRTGKSLMVDEETEKKINSGGIITYGEPSPIWLGVPIFNSSNEAIGVAALQNYTEKESYTSKDLDVLEYITNHIGAIIEKKNAQDKIHNSEEKLRSFIELSQIGICSISPQNNICVNSELKSQLNDILSGEFVECNKSFSDAYGLNKKDIISKQVIKILAKKIDCIGLISKFIKNNYQLSGEVICIEDNIKKTRLYISCSIVGRVINHHLTDIWITQVDITKRIETENELSVSKKKAEESDRLKLAFLSNMSHEIRTPMNAIIGFSSLLTEASISEEEKKDFVQRIITNGENLLNIINDILDISKLETNVLTFEYKGFEVKKIMDELYNEFLTHKKSIEKEHIKLIYNKPSTISSLYLHSDPHRIKQILSNLLNNAFKYTDSGHVKFGVKYSGESKLVFYVEDSGIGIPINKIDIIFDHFRQVDDSHTREQGGTGIGLTIAKKLTTRLNGNLWVSSEENKGSTFYLEIPFENQDYIQFQQELPKAETKTDLNNLTILIAEDVDSNFFVIKRPLLNAGIKIIRAENGKKAIEMFKKFKNIDIILMDIRMPIMDGVQATKKIKEINANTPIIALTAYATLEDHVKLIREGFDDFIAKPVDKHLLLETINKHSIKNTKRK